MHANTESPRAALRKAHPHQESLATRLKLAGLESVLWLFQLLPLPAQSKLGWTLGSILWHFDGAARKTTEANVRVCFPDLPPGERRSLAKESYCWFTRSKLERGVVRFFQGKRSRHVILEGDFEFASRQERPVMWIVPHFIGIDHLGLIPDIICQKPLATVYAPPPDRAIDLFLQRIRKKKHLDIELMPRNAGPRRLLQLIREGRGFLNFPDMDWGEAGSAFIDFFGQPASTMLAPSKIARMFDMPVQFILPEFLPHGQGYRFRFFDPPPGFPSDDPVADMTLFNRWLEERIRENPAQYMWWLERFRTRPTGMPPAYD